MTKIILFIMLAVVAVWLGATIGDRSYPTTIEYAKLLTPEVKRGDDLITERTVYRARLCHTTIERMMFDSHDIRFDLSEQGLGTITYPNGAGPLGRDTFKGQQRVPENMALGPARYVALVCYRCNWSQWLFPVCEPPREQRFKVVP